MNNCQICEAETESDYCLKCMAKAVVKWMPGWIWVDEFLWTHGIEPAIKRASGTSKHWKEMLTNRNLWAKVEKKIRESDAVLLDEYVENLYTFLPISDYNKSKIDTLEARLAEPKKCLKAFAKTSQIQEILKDMKGDKGE